MTMARTPARDRTQENRLRLTAKRQGLELHKSGRRDPRALDYGLYRITDGDAVLLETRDLDAIEQRLNSGPIRA